MQLLGMLTLQNYARLSILTSEIDHKNLRSISKFGYFTEQYVKYVKRQIYKIQNGHQVTSPYVLGDGINIYTLDQVARKIRRTENGTLQGQKANFTKI